MSALWTTLMVPCHIGRGKVNFSTEVLSRTGNCQSVRYVTLLCVTFEYALEKCGNPCASHLHFPTDQTAIRRTSCASILKHDGFSVLNQRMIQSGLFCFLLHHDRWLAYGRPPSPRIHGMCNQKCQGDIDCPRLPPTPHRSARCISLCDPGHHPNNERLHVARRRHTAQDPPDSPLPHHQFPHHTRQTTRKRTCISLVPSLL